MDLCRASSAARVTTTAADEGSSCQWSILSDHSPVTKCRRRRCHKCRRASCSERRVPRVCSVRARDHLRRARCAFGVLGWPGGAILLTRGARPALFKLHRPCQWPGATVRGGPAGSVLWGGTQHLGTKANPPMLLRESSPLGTSLADAPMELTSHSAAGPVKGP